MAEVKISADKGIGKALAPGSGSILKQAGGTLGDIISLMSKVEQFGSHVENIVGMFKGGEGAGSSIIQSKGDTPPADATPPATETQEIKKPPTAPTQKANDKTMEAYFSSPEGLKKIVDAIDKMVPLIGDLKLSEVKAAIIENIEPKKKPKKKGEKKDMNKEEESIEKKDVGSLEDVIPNLPKEPEIPKEPKKEPQPKKEEGAIIACGRCGSPMKKNLEKQIWECTNPKCGYDKAF